MRRLGVLLHITSLCGNDLIGSLGHEAIDMLETLKKAHISIWQMLPMCPIGYGASPYSSPSLFANNIFLINIEKLLEDNFITKEDYDHYFSLVEKRKKMAKFNKNKVDYSFLSQHKLPLLYKCATHFLEEIKNNKDVEFEYQTFCKDEEYWLLDYAIFSVLNNKVKLKMPNIIELYKMDKIDNVKKQHYEAIEKEKILQFLFFRQWANFKNEANKRNILLFGDLAMFPSYHSSDVASHSELFYLDKNNEAELVAGVPPDYFSSTGQLWGNPVYNWQKMKEDNYFWWRRRIKKELKLFDLLRLDHFRGFQAFWAIPSYENTAKNGSWMQAGGVDFFKSLQEELKTQELPLIAEDLGIITHDVYSLKNTFGLKGMKILQFAFNVEEYKNKNVTSNYLPHNVEVNSIIYTGTHDNTTTLAFAKHLMPAEKEFITKYLGIKENSSAKIIAEHLVRLAISSPAKIAIIPMQDFCLLDESSRMNVPGAKDGNWEWRLSSAMFEECIIEKIRDMAILYSRHKGFD